MVSHRDIKLENTLLAGEGSPPRALICDFGYSKDSILNSRPDTICGTPAYMAPEQAKTNAVLARAMFKTLGDTMGMTPEEAFAKFGPKITKAESVPPDQALSQQRQMIDLRKRESVLASLLDCLNG